MQPAIDNVLAALRSDMSGGNKRNAVRYPVFVFTYHAFNKSGYDKI